MKYEKLKKKLTEGIELIEKFRRDTGKIIIEQYLANKLLEEKIFISLRDIQGAYVIKITKGEKNIVRKISVLDIICNSVVSDVIGEMVEQL
jgi:hypothetical protein